MQDELVERLTDFGFTVNQAKVYLSIAQSSRTHVGKISKDTQLHRQDIYKLLPKLEKMGLITKTIDKPFKIEALPVQKALENLIVKEKERTNQRIFCLEKTLKLVTQAVQQQLPLKEEACFTLLTTGEAMKNRSNQTFKKKRKNFNIVVSSEILHSETGHFYRSFFQMILDKGSKIRLIIVGVETAEEINLSLAKICPADGYFEVKLIERCAFKDYQVVDKKEVWIATQQKSPDGYPAVLWTNDPNMVDAYFLNFTETWNNPKAMPILIAKIQSPLHNEGNMNNLIAVQDSLTCGSCTFQ